VAGVVGNQDEWPLGREVFSAYDLRPEIEADKGEEERPDNGRKRVMTAIEIHPHISIKRDTFIIP
jgi:hypothetical protein